MLRVQESELAGLKGKLARGLENTSGLGVYTYLCSCK